MEVEILFEDKDIIVCHKPAGMATQARRLGQQDMETYLKNYRAGKKETPYIGVVHRLDQPVEGVMVFAKNQKAAGELSRQIQRDHMGKHYYARSASTAIIAKSGSLQDYMLTDKQKNMSRIVDKGTAGAKPASLDYTVCGSDEKGTVFDITLHTGRQHQIRLQLSHIGFPIEGDKKYGGAQVQDGLKLCAYKLKFVHPASGKTMEFSIKPHWK